MAKEKPKQRPGGLWIPRDILSLPDVKPIDMLIMARVDSFRPRECAGSNKFLAEPFNVSGHTAQHSVRRCRTKGYLVNRSKSRHCRRLLVDHDKVRQRGIAKSALPKPKRVEQKVLNPP